MASAVSAVGTEPQRAQVTTPVGNGTLDYNAFLKLLLAQMQNQDPLAPTASSDYVAQLATFSQVEQSMQSNEKLNALLASSMVSQAGSLVGRQITSSDGGVTGVVQSARIEDGGIVAVLADGGEVAVGPGVVVGGRSA